MSNYKEIREHLFNLSPSDLLRLKSDIEIEWLSGLIGGKELSKWAIDIKHDIKHMIWLQNNKVRKNQDTIHKHLIRLDSLDQKLDRIEKCNKEIIAQANVQKGIRDGLDALASSIITLVTEVKENIVTNNITNDLDYTSNSEWMNANQVAKYLHCHSERVRQLRNEGRLGGIQLKNISGKGTRWIFPKASIDDYLNNKVEERRIDT